MSKHKKIRFIIHYVKHTAQLLFKIRFPKGGPTCRRQVVNPRHQTPQVIQLVIPHTSLWLDVRCGCVLISASPEKQPEKFLRRGVKYAPALVEATIMDADEASNEWYDRKMCGAALQPAAYRELDHHIRLKGKQQLVDGWNEEVCVVAAQPNTVKPVYNDHLMGYLSAFWSSSRWPRAT